jgi:OFA family oxalate/formate antiporter-like MFS transporter
MEHREQNSGTLKQKFVLPAAVLIQMCLGGVYAWSVFVPSLSADYGLTASQTQFIFGLTFGTFTVSMLLAGRLLPGWGPRWVGFLGGLLFACGHMAASASGGRFLGLLLGYGLIGGAGIGFGYVAALTAGVQWYPRQRGLITGVAVAGFGIGSVLLATLATSWMRSGWTILEVWRTIGWAYGSVVCAGSLLLFIPPVDSADAEVKFSGGNHLLKDPVFRVLGTGMFCGTFAGLLVIGLLKPIGIACGLPPETATTAVGSLAAGNAAGRIAWGWIHDRFGYPAIPGSLLFLCVALGALFAAGFVPFTFVAAALLVGFGFGASFVVYAAQVAARYGVKDVGRVYPLLFLAYGVAGITGPLLGGLLHDWTGSYLWPIAVSAAVAVAGAWWTGRRTEAKK